MFFYGMLLNEPYVFPHFLGRFKRSSQCRQDAYASHSSVTAADSSTEFEVVFPCCLPVSSAQLRDVQGGMGLSENR